MCVCVSVSVEVYVSKCQCSKDFPEEPFAMLSGKIRFWTNEPHLKRACCALNTALDEHGVWCLQNIFHNLPGVIHKLRCVLSHLYSDVQAHPFKTHHIFIACSPAPPVPISNFLARSPGCCQSKWSSRPTRTPNKIKQSVCGASYPGTKLTSLRAARFAEQHWQLWQVSSKTIQNVFLERVVSSTFGMCCCWWL